MGTKKEPEKEIHRTKYGRVLSMGDSAPPMKVHFTHPEVLRILLFKVLMEVPLNRHDGFNHWPLVIKSISKTSSLPRGQEGGTESSNP